MNLDGKELPDQARGASVRLGPQQRGLTSSLVKKKKKKKTAIILQTNLMQEIKVILEASPIIYFTTLRKLRPHRTFTTTS